MKVKLIFLFFAFHFMHFACAQKAKSFDVQSPDGNIPLLVEAAGKIIWSVNADRNATDYKKEIITISSGDKIDINLAPGSGWVARISKTQ